MKYFFTIWLSGCFLLNAISQPMQKDSSISATDLSNLTVMLYQPITGIIGTGTIATFRSKYYLITAEHVAKQMQQSTKIVFHSENDEPLVFDLKQFCKKNTVKWASHPIADISAMEIVPFDLNLKNRFLTMSFPVAWMSGYNTKFNGEFDFTYLGYPVLDLEMKHFSPLIFASKKVSGLVTQPRLDDQNKKCDFYYLDKPSMQGCSGSGVYISVSNNSGFLSAQKTVFVGVIHGTQGDSTGGKLAMVTPSSYVLELLISLMQ